MLGLTVSLCLLAGGRPYHREVQPVAASSTRGGNQPPLRVVYIQRNAQADDTAPDLASAIENGFQCHHIGTRVVTSEPADDNAYVLTYVATGGVMAGV